MFRYWNYKNRDWDRRISDMKMKIEKDDVLFEPEHDMDLFWIGVISSKNPCSVRWVNNEITGMAMKVGHIIKGLGENRNG